MIKQYDDEEAVLKGVSFEIERGKFYTLLGPSGCGKTTILRLIAGFAEPTEGSIYLNGKKSTTFPPMSGRSIRYFRTMRCFRI